MTWSELMKEQERKLSEEEQVKLGINFSLNDPIVKDHYTEVETSKLNNLLNDLTDNQIAYTEIILKNSQIIKNLKIILKKT